jgi:hypothetical protein
MLLQCVQQLVKQIPLGWAQRRHALQCWQVLQQFHLTINPQQIHSKQDDKPNDKPTEKATD